MKYKEFKGLSYHLQTSQAVINVLNSVFMSGTRIRLDYGDIKTGQSWGETYDVEGYVRSSVGPTKIPILIYNRRSMGGSGILTHCIVRIQESKGKRVLYEHPQYKPYK